MKKIMFLSMMMVLALTAGTIYADESGSLPYNGITVFSTGPVAFDDVPLLAGTMNWSYEEGSAAGGWREEEAMTETHPYNGVTIFSDRAIDFDSVPLGAVAQIGTYEEGTAAGGLHEEEAMALPENGITIFSKEPVAYDSLPVRW
ncbi:MAG TPA: hypothetical protein VFK23_08850 [Nitrospirota bacterium]|nr:hypothetical protein [Nitrospirota bacterium]